MERLNREVGGGGEEKGEGGEVAREEKVQAIRPPVIRRAGKSRWHFLFFDHFSKIFGLT